MNDDGTTSLDRKRRWRVKQEPKDYRGYHEAAGVGGAG